MKKLFVCVVAAAIICAFALPNLFAADAPADGLKMDKTKTPVVFNHSTHKAEDCEFCHHKSKDNPENIKKCSSEGCHDNFDKKAKGPENYYKAIHGAGKTIPTCLSCHKEKAGKDKDMKKKLTGCKKSACHP